MNWNRNNLDQSDSPYLRQHSANPVWWQEWSDATLAYARERSLPLLVSVGYSTCHWCHVMAADSFSDPDCAAFLNDHFVSIKVDREVRPDIDHYLMRFLVATTGSGGWPLNAFLTPDLRPFFAMTYASPVPRFGRPGFRDILERVVDYYREHEETIAAFVLTDEASRARVLPPSDAPSDQFLPLARDEDEAELAACIDELRVAYDTGFGGFGAGQKFPPHAPLLFLNLVAATGTSDVARSMVEGTLTAMQERGLHDHLQGGFFRYTVDREWTIPHFEKMLYDQALLLWNYALGAKLTGRADFAATARGVVRCLDETFVIDGFYASGHDADTDHEEGSTYLWSTSEIERILAGDELLAFRDAFDVTSQGNFEGRNHLVRRTQPEGDDPQLVLSACERLLIERLNRRQPDRDEKILVSWNALTGCALLAAGRYVDSAVTERAIDLARRLVEAFVRGSSVCHGAIAGRLQEQRFLADHAALLVFLTMAAEESMALRDEFEPVIESLAAGLADFYEPDPHARWVENLTADFGRIPADSFDQPVPSGVGMAELALTRRSLMNHAELAPLSFADAEGHSFANIAALISRGYVYAVESPTPYEWNVLPLNSIQIPGDARTSCYRGVCYLGPPPPKSHG